MKKSSTDRVEKRIELKAPVGKVWRALTDVKQFAAWSRMGLEGRFEVGKTTRGNVLEKGYEQLRIEITPVKIEPETYFSYHWHPFPADPKRDYSKETPTLVEFRLEPAGKGTLLTVVESGFDRIPADRRSEAFRMHDGGWEAQLGNVADYVVKKS